MQHPHYRSRMISSEIETQIRIDIYRCSGRLDRRRDSIVRDRKQTERRRGEYSRYRISQTIWMESVPLDHICTLDRPNLCHRECNKIRGRKISFRSLCRFQRPPTNRLGLRCRYGTSESIPKRAIPPRNTHRPPSRICLRCGPTRWISPMGLWLKG